VEESQMLWEDAEPSKLKVVGLSHNAQQHHVSTVQMAINSPEAKGALAAI